jgi:hypothetical protein
MVSRRSPRNTATRTLAAGALTAALLTPAAVAAAGTPTPTTIPTATLPAPTATHIAVNRVTSNCDGWVLLAYSIEDLNGQLWTPHPDDGATVTPQTHFIGNGAGLQGQWGDLPAASGGEGVIRVDMRGIPTHDRILRVRRNGITSTPKPITECPTTYIEK